MNVMRALIVLLLLLALDARHLARADNWGSPMTFTLAPNGSIFADGDIVADTPERLQQFLSKNKIPPDGDLLLTSRGGNLAAGLEMGELIRARRLHTWVGSDTKIAGLYHPIRSILTGRSFDIGTYPGYCVSACTLAFLGGVERSMWKGSIYAVHQAAMECKDPAREPVGGAPQKSAGADACPTSMQAFSNAQAMAGVLVAYVQKMGVDPAFLTEMSAADPTRVNRLSEEQMKKYKIIYRPGGSAWTIETTSTGQFFLRETVTTEWKTDYLQFICRRDPDPRLVVVVVYDPATAGGTEDVDKIVDSGRQGLELSYFPLGWSLTHKWFEKAPAIVLGPEEVLRYPFKTAQGKVELAFLASPRILDALRTSTSFTVSNRLAGKDYVDFAAADPIDRTRLDEFTASCH